MCGQFDRRGLFSMVIAIAFGLCASAGTVEAEGWGDQKATETSAGNIDDHESSSENPDGAVAKGEDPDAMVVESESMEGRVVGAENPAAMETQAGRVDQHDATSESLSDPNEVAPEGGYEAILVPGQADWMPTTDPQVLLAREKLVRAQKRAEAAITAYGDAQERDYPRGQARIRIVNERDAAMKALEDAKRALAEVE